MSILASLRRFRRTRQLPQVPEASPSHDILARMRVFALQDRALNELEGFDCDERGPAVSETQGPAAPNDPLGALSEFAPQKR